MMMVQLPGVLMTVAVGGWGRLTHLRAAHQRWWASCRRRFRHNTLQYSTSGGEPAVAAVSGTIHCSIARASVLLFLIQLGPDKSHGWEMLENTPVCVEGGALPARQVLPVAALLEERQEKLAARLCLVLAGLDGIE